jgi:uncharacterized protein YciI
MTQFVLIARDGTDADAPTRRQNARAEHMLALETLKAQGHALAAAAMTDAAGTMNGSTLILDFADRAALDAWLATEPYVRHNVWQSIEIHPARIPPLFSDLLKGTNP